MNPHSISKFSITKFEVALVILGTILLLLQSGKFQSPTCNCEQSTTQGVGLNIELKDFFFKYQNF